MRPRRPTSRVRAIAELLAVAAWLGCACAASAQPAVPAEGAGAPRPAAAAEPINPLRLIEAAGQAMPALGGAAPRAGADDAAPSTGKGLHGAISILLVMTVLTVAPSLLVLTTSFTRIVIVLSLLRQAIGTQSLPPSQVIVGLALFMTFLVMGPTFERINAEALAPLRAGNIEADEAWARARQPMRDFMFEQLHHASNWQDLYLMLQFRGVDVSEPEKLSRDDVDTLALIPAYILSELKVSFLMGFKLYLPFLVIDMVVSSVLISMGMLMLPPVLISLPFKLLLFVLVDGWRLVAGNLLGSFAVEGVKLAGSG